MGIAILFWAMMAAACGYAVVLGGWEGKCTTAIIASSALAITFSDSWPGLHWHKTDLTVLAIALVALVAMYLVAAFSRRWWPLWVAAFQLNSVAAYLATSFSPHLSILQGYETLWSIPGQIIMVVGIFRDRNWKYRYELA